MTVIIAYISFENMLTKKWPGIYILVEFSWGHNQTPKAASNIHGTVQLLHGMYK